LIVSRRVVRLTPSSAVLSHTSESSANHAMGRDLLPVYNFKGLSAHHVYRPKYEKRWIAGHYDVIVEVNF
jgi:hypothetical protein